MAWAWTSASQGLQAVSSSAQAFFRNLNRRRRRALSGLEALENRRLLSLVELVTRSTSGEAANSYSSYGTISDDGRYVVFDSPATNLDPTVSVTPQVYLRDLVAQTTTVVSTGPSGAADRGASDAAISGNGRYVVFSTRSTNLGLPFVVTPTGPLTSASFVYRKDLQTGDLRYIGIGEVYYTGGAVPRNSISTDGRYVMYYTTSDSVALGGAVPRVARWDADTNTEIAVSVDDSGTPLPDPRNDLYKLSRDGEHVAFASRFPSVVTAPALQPRVNLRDIPAGRTFLVSTGPNGEANNEAQPLAVSGDGRYVVFGSAATNLPGSSPVPESSVFLRDTVLNETTRLGARPGGGYYGGMSVHSTSPDGRYLYGTISFNNYLMSWDRVTGNLRTLAVREVDSPPLDASQLQVSGDNSTIVFFNFLININQELLNSANNLYVRPTNFSPYGITPSSTSVAENSPANTVVATLQPKDYDQGDPTTFSLVTGAGDADNSLFSISGNQLRANQSFDFESRSSYSVRVRATDSFGGIFEASIPVTIVDGNDAPIGLSPTTASVPENSPPGTLVATLTSQDNDIGDQFTYSLVTGAGDTDNALFQISGNHLLTVGMLDFEAQSSSSVRIRTTDLLGGTFEAAVTINVTNVVELAMRRGLSPATQLHFFTTNSVEFNGQVAAGMVNEGGPNGAFSVLDGTATGGTPIYRLFNPRQGGHYLTANLLERDALLALGAGGSDGWIAEGIDGYLRAQSQPGTVEVFHLYDRMTGSHLFTTNQQERDAALASPGDGLGSFWQQHTSLGYVFVSSPAQAYFTSAPVSAAPAVAAPPEAELRPEIGSPSSDDFAGLASLIRVDESVLPTDLSQPGEDSPYDAPTVATLETYGTQQPVVPLPLSVTATPVGDETDGE